MGDGLASLASLARLTLAVTLKELRAIQGTKYAQYKKTDPGNHKEMEARSRRPSEAIHDPPSPFSPPRLPIMMIGDVPALARNAITNGPRQAADSISMVIITTTHIRCLSASPFAQVICIR
ncbi:hypothetical protein HYFRA_00003303 [Hymenoscyphus fraxineus]|uniref:Uncharacterized protein n=1 Tax=Hymenoscyphus fraxineus TaxID=746836 RepID=A0A9N9PN61_9HELO|nr:hypothetical protein HYFRA_00003303 [Hymenoscyphus fraxineus]